MRKGGESSAAQADEPGFTRRRRGRGWSYQDRDGATITDPVVRARIDALAIPPAWYDVWITPFANGHLQAVGTDTAGRRQYLYHADWLTDRGRIKYERALALGRALPRGRAMVAQDLSRPTLGRDLVLATAFRLLDRGHFRVGSAAYADRYGSYGLSTLRRDHVQRRRGTLVFSYVAKGGLGRVERIEDPDLLDTVGALLRRRGGPDLDELLVYRDSNGWWRITGADINEYVRQALRLEASAKDFRTWHGTVLGAVAAAAEFRRHRSGQRWSARALDRAIRNAVIAVAENLGNTPAVCRSSYVHPGVIDQFRRGATIDHAVTRIHGWRAIEKHDRPLDAEWVNMVGSDPAVERATLRLVATHDR